MSKHSGQNLIIQCWCDLENNVNVTKTGKILAFKEFDKRKYPINSKQEIMNLSEKFWEVSGLPVTFCSLCCLGFATILEFKTIEIAWPINN